MVKILLALVSISISLPCFGSTPGEIKETHLQAEQGIASAQINLGVMYAEGQGVPEDNVFAYMWFNLAAQGYEDAKNNKGIISKLMTKEQIAEAQKLSREWLAKHSE